MIDRIGGNRSAGMDLFPRSPTDLTFTTFFTQSMIPPSVSVECKMLHSRQSPQTTSFIAVFESL